MRVNLKISKRRSLLAVVALAVLAFVVCVLFRIAIPVGGFRAKVEGALERALGREVAIEGGVGLVLGFPVEVRVGDVAVANPAGWEGGGDFARVERVVVRVELGALLRKEVVVERLEVEGVAVALEDRGEGNVNWEFGGAGVAEADVEEEGGGYSFGGIELVAARDLAVVTTDAEGRRKPVIELDTLEGGGKAGEAAVFTATGKCIRRPIVLRLEGGPLEALFAGEKAWPIRVGGKLGVARIAVDGELPVRGEKGRGFRFGAELPRLDDFEAVTGPLPEPGVLAFSGAAKLVEGGFWIPVVEGTLGDAAFSGRLAVGLSGPAPGVDAAIEFDRLELAKFREDDAEDEAEEARPVKDFDEAFGQDVDVLDAAGERALLGHTGKLEVKVGQLIGKRGEMHDVRLVADTDANGTSLEASAAFLKSRFTAAAKLRRAPGEGLRFGVELTSEDVDAGELLGLLFGYTWLKGRGKSLDYRFEGAGENWREVREATVSELSVVIAGANYGMQWGGGEEGILMSIEGERLADLAAAIEGVPEWDVAYAANGRFHKRDAEARWRIEGMETRIGEDLFEGKLVRPHVGGLGIALRGEGIAVGRILGDLEVIEEGVVANAEEVELSAEIEGKTMREILANSMFGATLRSGSWRFGGAKEGKALDLDFDEVRITSERGEPQRFEIDGRLSNAALTLRGETDGLTAYAEQSQDMHLLVEAVVGGTKLVFDDRVALPLDRSDFSGVLKLEGGKMSELNELLDAELPEWGPYSVVTEFGFLEDGYGFEKIAAKIGETDLEGELRLRTGGARRNVEGNFSSKRIQITDFHEAGWSPYDKGDEKEEEEKWRPGSATDAFHGALASLLSAEFLGSVDGEISLEAGGVYSGEERLGGGAATARLSGGKLRVAPAELNIPGGKVNLEIGFARPGGKIETEFVLRMSGFDYGAFARHSDPGAEGGGRLDFAMDGRSLSPKAGSFWAYGNGTVSAAVCPEQVGAQVFDIWATNLVTSLIPKLDPERRSKINCIVAEASVAGGLATFDKLIIDTTRVRAEGKGTIDFKNERVDLMVVPQAKTPQVLNLATGLTIDGTFENFGRRVTAADAIKTVSETGKRTLLFPLRFLKERTSESLPADGSDVCPCLE